MIMEGPDLITMMICAIEDADDQLFMCRLYEEYEQLMFWAASKYLNNIEDRKDAVQDAIVALIKNIATLKTLGDSNLRTYIVCAVESRAINLVKRKNKEQHLFDDLDSIPVGTAVDMIEDKMLQIAMRSSLMNVWPQLSTQDKILLESKYILGYNDNEIGKLLGCKASSVRMYLTRARRRAVELISEVKMDDPS